MAKVLGVGIATLDIISYVDAYPQEDQELRASGQQLRRGGNVTNTLSVLAQFGHQCSWAGTFVDDASMVIIARELDQDGIDMRWAQRVAQGRMPVSSVLINSSSGSRTIVHYRDLPEFGFDRFAAIDLATYDWLHFEGRNIDATCDMIAHARAVAPDLPVSVEIEKPRAGIERLSALADVCLFSRGYAQVRGYAQARSFLDTLSRQLPGIDLVCAWGDEGAYAVTRQGEALHAKVSVPGAVVDTLGAGDVLNAGVIHAYLGRQPLACGLDFACRLASKKCTQQGLRALV